MSLQTLCTLFKLPSFLTKTLHIIFSPNLPYKYTFPKRAIFLFDLFFTPLDFSRYLRSDFHLSVCDAYGKRGRNENHLGTLTVTPCSRDFPSPIIIIDTIGPTFSTFARARAI